LADLLFDNTLLEDEHTDFQLCFAFGLRH
jgi:hypothetical protein